jgi:integrase
VSAEAVAAYLAKYATKATEPTCLPITGRMTAEAAEYYSDPDTHLGRLVGYAHQLGTLPENWITEQQRARLARHLWSAPPLDPHARLRRPLRHEVPPLLDHPQTPAPLEPRNLTRSWERLCKQLDIRHVPLHGLRHTCVSLLLALGVHPRVVMEIVGHSAIEMTMNIYGHVNVDTQRVALDRLDDDLSG